MTPRGLNGRRDTEQRKHPRIVVYGQHKTGTTGCFFLIRNSLAHAPRELFECTRWEPLSDDRSRPVLAKVMVPPGSPLQPVDVSGEDRLRAFRHFDRQVYLLRDPRDWLVSGVLFLSQEYPPFYRSSAAVERLLSLLRGKEQAPSSVAMLDLLEVILQAGGVTVDDWLPGFLNNHYDRLFRFEDELGPHCRWRYEDFVAGHRDAVERYLGFRLEGSSAPDPAYAHVPRSRASGGWRHWLTPADVARLEPLLMRYIERHDYDRDWALHSESALNPDHGSRYVQRIVAARLRAERSDTASGG